MREVGDLFKAKALTTYGLFTDNNSSTGFSIPEYQRIYSWDTKNIERLFDDIREGVLALSDDEDSITFVGTLIVSSKEIDSFQGTVLSVVDGQQRITTLSLICAMLHQKLSAHNRIPEDIDEKLAELVRDLVKYASERLFAMVSGTFEPFAKKSDKLYPRVIREEDDSWNRIPKEAYYESPVSRYLKDFIDNAFNKDEYSFVHVPHGNSENVSLFQKNLKCIETNIADLEHGRPFGLMKKEDAEIDPLPNWRRTMESKKLRTVLLRSHPPIPQDTAIEMLKIGKPHEAWLDRVIRLLSYSNYLMNRVSVTRVVSAEDKYAFDIFEALNTAGEPLTALETFKPIVYRAEENHNGLGYARSSSKDVFDQLKRYLEREEFDDASKRQRESADIVVAFASMLDGKKESLHLSSQRKYLRTRYESLNTYKAKTRLVQELGNLLTFKERFWIESNLETAIFGADKRDFALFCAGFIKDMKTTVTIPVLARYYKEKNTTVSHTNDFVDALIATAAFLALWRAYTGGSAQIDSRYRSIMSTYGNKLGTQIDNAPIKVEKLKKAYRKMLEQLLSKENAESYKKAWVNKAAQKPLYDLSKPLCRFLLLLTGTDTEVDESKHHLLKPTRPNTTETLTTLAKLRSNEFSTLEHVAPQSPNQDMSWDRNIYAQDGMKSCIGNLILMPQAENSGVGNVGWDRKRVYYKAFSESDPGKLSEHIQEASQKGFKFKESTKDMISRGSCLPTLKSISMVDEWNSETISERSKNLMEISWTKLHSLLD